MDGEQLWDIIEGMKANGLLEYSHLVTGVCKHASLHSHEFHVLDLPHREVI